MKRSMIGVLVAGMMLGNVSFTLPTIRHSRTKRTYAKPRNPAGSKIARKATNGVLTLRHPSGIVAQTFREMQQRNFKQGANK